MSLITLLFILLLIWIVPKLIRGFLFVHRVRKQARTVYEQMYNGTAGHGRQQQRKPGWSAPVARRKKIDPTVGEYVKFQEISVTETTQSGAGNAAAERSEYTVEQQVTDAEWEDL